jgi:hypothetical protein
MSRKMVKYLALGAMLVSGLTASSASAANWQSNGTAGGSAFSATGAKVVVKSALSNGFGYNCTGSSLSGSLFGPTGPASTSAWTNVETFTPAFTTCSIAGVPVTISGVGVGHFDTDANGYSGGVASGRFHANWTATFVTCPFTVVIDAPATTNGVALTLGQSQSGTVSWPSGNTACDNLTGTTGGGSSNVRLVGFTTTFIDAVFTYSGGVTPSIFY